MDREQSPADATDPGQSLDDERPWYETVALPALLRHARTTYGSAMRTAQADVGCDDIPRNGIYVIGAIARGGSPLGGIIEDLGVSKQAAGQLVDTLVIRGYLDRAPDPDDRRRMTVSLTERGRTAAAAGREAVERIDRQLETRVGVEHVAHTRATLAALIGLGRDET
jgi:DNA-binding MarR family transcriptional regulator